MFFKAILKLSGQYQPMMSLMKNFWRDEEGTTALEYAFIAGLVSIGAIVALTNLADSLSGMYTYISSNVNNSLP